MKRPAGAPEPRESALYARNLAAMALFQAIVAVGYSFAFPFMPLYLGELGVTDADAVKLWSGAIFAGSSVTMAVMGPVWGAFADQFGPRLMVYRAVYSVVVIVGFIGFATSPEQVLLLRIVQGAITGVNTAAMTLMAMTSPAERLGFSLGAMQTAGYIGVSVGPLAGGWVADHYGYRTAFFCAAGISLIAGLVFTFGFVGDVDHGADRQTKPDDPATFDVRAFWRVLREVIAAPIVFALVVQQFFSQAAQHGIAPVLPLYVLSIAGPGEPIASTTGLIVGISALCSSISAVVLGRLGDQIGHSRILLLCGAAIAAAYVAQVFATTTWQVLAIQAVAGGGWGGMITTTSALLALHSDPNRRGATYGVLASANSLGNGVGPLTAAIVAVWFDLRAVFLAIGIGIAVVTFQTVRRLNARPRASDASSSSPTD